MGLFKIIFIYSQMALEIIENSKYPYKLPVFELSNDNEYSKVVLDTITIDDQRNNVTYNNNALMFLRNRETIQNIVEGKELIENILDLTPDSKIVIPTEDSNENNSNETITPSNKIVLKYRIPEYIQEGTEIIYFDDSLKYSVKSDENTVNLVGMQNFELETLIELIATRGNLLNTFLPYTTYEAIEVTNPLVNYYNDPTFIVFNDPEDSSSSKILVKGGTRVGENSIIENIEIANGFYYDPLYGFNLKNGTRIENAQYGTALFKFNPANYNVHAGNFMDVVPNVEFKIDDNFTVPSVFDLDQNVKINFEGRIYSNEIDKFGVLGLADDKYHTENSIKFTFQNMEDTIHNVIKFSHNADTTVQIMNLKVENTMNGIPPENVETTIPEIPKQEFVEVPPNEILEERPEIQTVGEWRIEKIPFENTDIEDIVVEQDPANAPLEYLFNGTLQHKDIYDPSVYETPEVIERQFVLATWDERDLKLMQREVVIFDPTVIEIHYETLNQQFPNVKKVIYNENVTNIYFAQGDSLASIFPNVEYVKLPACDLTNHCANCTKLNWVDFDENVNALYENEFANCESLIAFDFRPTSDSTVTIHPRSLPPKVEIMRFYHDVNYILKGNCFDGCSEMKYMYWPLIGSGNFENMSLFGSTPYKLQMLDQVFEFPKHFTTIPRLADVDPDPTFVNKTVRVIIPEDVISIQEGAFDKKFWPNLQKIICYGSVDLSEITDCEVEYHVRDLTSLGVIRRLLGQSFTVTNLYFDGNLIFETSLVEDLYNYMVSIENLISEITIEFLAQTGDYFPIESLRCLTFKHIIFPKVASFDKNITDYLDETCSYELPEIYTEIKNNAFGSKIKNQDDLPKGLKRIGDHAFAGNQGLSEMIFPTRIWDISGNNIFKDCTNLQRVRVSPFHGILPVNNIPTESVFSNIQDWFNNNPLLEEIILPPEFADQTLDDWNFEDLLINVGNLNCKIIQEVTIAEANNEGDITDDIISSLVERGIHVMYDINITAPNVTRITAEKFSRLNIRSINIPETCCDIPTNMFDTSHFLKEFRIPIEMFKKYCTFEREISIGDTYNPGGTYEYLLYYCYNLERIILPRTLGFLDDVYIYNFIVGNSTHEIVFDENIHYLGGLASELEIQNTVTDNQYTHTFIMYDDDARSRNLFEATYTREDDYSYSLTSFNGNSTYYHYNKCWSNSGEKVHEAQKDYYVEELLDHRISISPTIKTIRCEGIDRTGDPTNQEFLEEHRTLCQFLLEMNAVPNHISSYWNGGSQIMVYADKNYVNNLSNTNVLYFGNDSDNDEESTYVTGDIIVKSVDDDILSDRKIFRRIVWHDASGNGMDYSTRPCRVKKLVLEKTVTKMLYNGNFDDHITFDELEVLNSNITFDYQDLAVVLNRFQSITVPFNLFFKWLDILVGRNVTIIINNEIDSSTGMPVLNVDEFDGNISFKIDPSTDMRYHDKPKMCCFEFKDLKIPGNLNIPIVDLQNFRITENTKSITVEEGVVAIYERPVANDTFIIDHFNSSETLTEISGLFSGYGSTGYEQIKYSLFDTIAIKQTNYVYPEVCLYRINSLPVMYDQTNSEYICNIPNYVNRIYENGIYFIEQVPTQHSITIDKSIINDYVRIDSFQTICGNIKNVHFSNKPTDLNEMSIWIGGDDVEVEFLNVPNHMTSCAKLYNGTIKYLHFNSKIELFRTSSETNQVQFFVNSVLPYHIPKHVSFIEPFHETNIPIHLIKGSFFKAFDTETNYVVQEGVKLYYSFKPEDNFEILPSTINLLLDTKNLSKITGKLFSINDNFTSLIIQGDSSKPFVIEDEAFEKLSTMNYIYIGQNYQTTRLHNYVSKNSSSWLDENVYPLGIGETNLTNKMIEDYHEIYPDLEVITIANGITSTDSFREGIGLGIFKKMKEVNFPPSMKFLGENLLKNCLELIKINWPDSIDSFRPLSIENCPKLTSITIPAGITYLSNKIAENCPNVTNFCRNDGLTEFPINEGQIQEFPKINTLWLSHTTTKVHNYNNDPNEYITDYLVHPNVEYIYIDSNDDPNHEITDLVAIHPNYFPNLKQIKLPKKYHHLINLEAWEGYDMKILDENGYGTVINITRIEDNKYKNDETLTAIYLPDTLTYIGDNAFEGCTNLKELYIPKSVTHIGNNINLNAGITKIYFADGATGLQVDSIDFNSSLVELRINQNVVDVLNTKTNPKFGRFLQNIECSDEILTLPESFFANHRIVKLKLPKKLKTIPDRLTYNSPFIGYLEWPEAVDTINTDGISSLNGSGKNGEFTELIFPDTLKHLGSIRFLSYFSKIFVPMNVESLDNDFTFVDFFNCREIIFEEGSLTKCENVTISNLGISLLRYLEKIYWPDSFNGKMNFIVHSDFDSKDSLYASHRNSIREVHLPNNITSLFENLPDNYVRTAPLSECPNLEKVNIPKKLKTIPWRFLKNDPMITVIEIPEATETIEEEAFMNCIGIKQLILPNTLKTIKNGAFAGMTSIEHIVLNDWFFESDYRDVKAAFCSTDGSSLPLLKLIEIKTSETKTELNIINLAIFRFLAHENNIYLSFPEHITKITEIEPEWNKNLEWDDPNHEDFTMDGIFSNIELPPKLEFLQTDIFINWTKESYPSFDFPTTYRFPETLTYMTNRSGVGGFMKPNDVFEKIYIPPGIRDYSCIYPGCQVLKEVYIPEGSLCEYADDADLFHECKCLESIVIPKSFKYLSRGAFAGCEKLKTLVCYWRQLSYFGYHYSNIIDYPMWEYENYAAPIETLYIIFDEDATIPDNAFMLMKYITTEEGSIEKLIPNESIKTIYFIKQDPKTGELLEFNDPKIKIAYTEKAFANCPNLTTFAVDQTIDNNAILTKMLQTQTSPDYSSKITGTILIHTSENVINRNDTYLAFTPTVYLPGQHLLMTYSDTTNPDEPSIYYNRLEATKIPLTLRLTDISSNPLAPSEFSIKQIYFSDRPDNKITNMTTFNNCFGIQIRTPSSCKASTIEEIKKMFIGMELILYREILNNDISEYYSFASMKMKFNLHEDTSTEPCCKWSIEEDPVDPNYLIYTLRVSAPKKIFKYKGNEIIANDDTESAFISIFEIYSEEGSLKGEINQDVEIIKNKYGVLNCQAGLLELFNTIPSGFIVPVVYYKDKDVIQRIVYDKITDYTYNIGGINKLNCRQYISYPNSLPYNALAAYTGITMDNVENAFIGSLELTNCEFCEDKEYGCCQDGVTNYPDENSDEKNFTIHPTSDCPPSSEMKIEESLMNNTPIYITTMLPIDEIQNGVEYESELIRGEINFVDSNQTVLQRNKYTVLKNANGSKDINILIRTDDSSYEITYPFQEIALMNHYECNYTTYTLIKKFNDNVYLNDQTTYYPNDKQPDNSYSYDIMQPYGTQSKSLLFYLNGMLGTGITSENYPLQTRPFIPLSENNIFNIDGNNSNIYRFEISSEVQTLNSEIGYGYLGDAENSSQNDIFDLGVTYSKVQTFNVNTIMKNTTSIPSILIHSNIESSDEFVKKLNYSTYKYNEWRQTTIQQILNENKQAKFIREPTVNHFETSVKYVVNDYYRTEIKQSIAESTLDTALFTANQAENNHTVYSIPNALISYVSTSDNSSEISGNSSEKLKYSGNVVLTENVYYQNKNKTLYTYGYDNSKETDDLKLLTIRASNKKTGNFTTDDYKELMTGRFSQQMSNSFYTYSERSRIYQIPIQDVNNYKDNLEIYTFEEIPEKTKIMFGRRTTFKYKYPEMAVYDDDGVTDLSEPLEYFPNTSNGWNKFIHEEYLDQDHITTINENDYYNLYVFDRKILEEHTIKSIFFRHQLDTVNDPELYQYYGLKSIRAVDYEILEIISPTFTFMNGEKIIIAKYDHSYTNNVHVLKLLVTKTMLTEQMGTPSEVLELFEKNNGLYSQIQFSTPGEVVEITPMTMLVLDSKNPNVTDLFLESISSNNMEFFLISDHYNMNYMVNYDVVDRFTDLMKFGEERVLVTNDFSRIIDSSVEDYAGMVYYPTTINQTTTIVKTNTIYPITYPGVPYRKYWSFYIPNYIDLKKFKEDSFDVISSNMLSSFKTQSYKTYDQHLGTVHIERNEIAKYSSNVETTETEHTHRLKLDTFFIPPGKYDSVEQLVENINSSIIKALRNGDNTVSISGNMSVIKDEVQINLSCPKILLTVDIDNVPVNIILDWDCFDYRAFKVSLYGGKKYIFVFGDQAVICELSKDLSFEFDIDVRNYIVNHALILKSSVGNACQIKFNDVISSDLITDKMFSDLLIEDKPFIEILDNHGIYTFKFVDSIIPVRFNTEDVPEKIDYMCLIEQNQNFQQDFSLSDRLQTFDNVNQLENEFSDKFAPYVKSYFENENFGISFKHSIKNIWYKLGIQPLTINKDFRPYILGPNDVLKVLKSGLNIEFNKIIYYNILSSDFVETNYLSDILTLPHVLYKRIDGKKKIFKGNQSINELNLFNDTWKGEHLPYLDIPERILIKTTTNEDIEYILNIGDNETIISETDNYELKNGKMYIKIYQTIETNNMDTIYIYIDSEEHYPFVNGVNAKLKVEWIK